MAKKTATKKTTRKTAAPKKAASAKAASRKITPSKEVLDKYSTAIILEAPHSKYADEVRERYKHLPWPKDESAVVQGSKQ